MTISRIVTAFICGSMSSALCAQVPESVKSRAVSILEAFSGQGVVRVGEKTRPNTGTLVLYLRKGRKEYLASLDADWLRINLASSSSIPSRTGPFPYSTESGAVSYVRARMQSLSSGLGQTQARFKLKAEQSAGPGHVRFGTATVTFSILKQGYGYIDRLYGAAVTIDIKTGELVGYTERMKVHPVGEARVELSQAQARASAATSLSVSGNGLSLTGLGWRKVGPGPGRLAYGFQHERPSPMGEGMTERRTIYIDSITGEPLGTDVLVLGNR